MPVGTKTIQTPMNGLNHQDNHTLASRARQSPDWSAKADRPSNPDHDFTLFQIQVILKE
jgi:hypothetical protein